MKKISGYFIISGAFLTILLNLSGCSRDEKEALPVTDISTYEANDTSAISATEESIQDEIIDFSLEDQVDDSLQPDYYLENIERIKEDGFFSSVPSHYDFCSGAGAWGTEINIEDDGTFVGLYVDSDAGGATDSYPAVTRYYCEFKGKFSEPQPTDNMFIYSTKLEYIDIKDTVGTSEILDDGALYVYSEPYGLEDADELLIYLPGAPISEMSDDCISWTTLRSGVFKKIPDGYYVIYNVDGCKAFTAMSRNSLWYHDCVYEYGDSYVEFDPDVWGTYLRFVKNDESLLSLQIPWDGICKDSLICEEAWSDNKNKYKVTIKPAKGTTRTKYKYVITVECSNTDFDFTAWGGTADGKFSAVFEEK